MWEKWCHRSKLEIQGKGKWQELAMTLGSLPPGTLKDTINTSPTKQWKQSLATSGKLRGQLALVIKFIMVSSLLQHTELRTPVTPFSVTQTNWHQFCCPDKWRSSLWRHTHLVPAINQAANVDKIYYKYRTQHLIRHSGKERKRLKSSASKSKNEQN